jgi:cytochrome c
MQLTLRGFSARKLPNGGAFFAFSIMVERCGLATTRHGLKLRCRGPPMPYRLTITGSAFRRNEVVHDAGPRQSFMPDRYRSPKELSIGRLGRYWSTFPHNIPTRLHQGEKAMFRRILLFATVVMVSSQGLCAQDGPPSPEKAKRIEALVNKAAALVDSKGKAALSQFRERGSEWWSGDLYVFAYAPDGTVLLNPAFPTREGHSYHGETDKNGKAFHDELIMTAQTRGSGWVDYWLPKPGHTQPSHKWSYVRAVKAVGIALVGAGFFPK